MSNYWYEVYGKRSRDFIEGVKAGVTTFAVWRNGKQLVGVLEKPLREVIQEIEEGMGGDDSVGGVNRPEQG